MFTRYFRTGSRVFESTVSTEMTTFASMTGFIRRSMLMLR